MFQMQLREGITGNLCQTKIEKAARTRLAKTGYRPLTAIICNFSDGTLVLQGEVPSYYHKQLAQEATRKMHNVHTVVNQIEVWP
jgi:osmotically-inducible protein OsmY